VRFDNGRGHAHFNLDATPPSGYKTVIRAAKDPISVPTDPAIVELATRNLCHLGLGEDCFTLTNVYGIEAKVPYGATAAEWEQAAAKLLSGAMSEE